MLDEQTYGTEHPEVNVIYEPYPEEQPILDEPRLYAYKEHALTRYKHSSCHGQVI